MFACFCLLFILVECQSPVPRTQIYPWYVRTYIQNTYLNSLIQRLKHSSNGAFTFRTHVQTAQCKIDLFEHVIFNIFGSPVRTAQWLLSHSNMPQIQSSNPICIWITSSNTFMTKAIQIQSSNPIYICITSSNTFMSQAIQTCHQFNFQTNSISKPYIPSSNTLTTTCLVLTHCSMDQSEYVLEMKIYLVIYNPEYMSKHLGENYTI